MKKFLIIFLYELANELGMCLRVRLCFKKDITMLINF